jgi:hypothetical protein
VRFLPWLWLLALAWAIWFAVRIWSDYGTMLLIGHGPALLLWGVPVVLLLLLPTWWILHRATGHRQWMPVLFLVGWIALIALPAPPQPVEYSMSGQTDTLTSVTGYFWVVMTLVSVLPIVLTLGMLVSVLRARPDED